MQRKTLNVFLYRDHSVENQLCYKIRLVEIQDLENCAENLDQTVIDLYTGIESPFAVCLSRELDKYKDNPGLPLIMSGVDNEEDGLFKRLRDVYTREVIRDKADAATYLYQDLDMILLASSSKENHRGTEEDMYCLLGAIDNAIQVFKTKAESDEYAVSLNVATSSADFTDKISIIRNAFSSPADDTRSISRQTAEWIVREVRASLPELQRNFAHRDFIDIAGHLNRILLEIKQDSLGPTILNDWYLKKQDTTSNKIKANMNNLFSSTIVSSIKPLMDSDNLLSTVRKKV
ncbi:MAG TPA: hypothetical protein VL360_06825 [Gammaproteobacteria bacterium]|jgi:hypothetical protein|nr:hypothetical protein [Gammaproteobacteria bacterium]